MTQHTHELAKETVGADEAAIISEFIDFLKAASTEHHPTGIMPRFNQGRAAGCAEAELIVRDDLPPELQVGLFAAPRSYPARVRFAHASSTSDVEKDTRGLSIKVLNAGGTNLTDGETAQDFILNSHPVMMVGASKDFLALLRANEAGGARRVLFFVSHPAAAAVALASRQNPTSPLEIPYWSTTPYLFGPGRAVKYYVRPASAQKTPAPEPLTANYLQERLVARLAKEDVVLDLFVQFQVDEHTTPIEDASIEWREMASPYRPLAHIRLPKQTLVLASACEQMSFNPWNARTEHRPLGNYNRARRAIYTAMAAFRHARG